MSFVNTWSTKEDVLKDLARASGRRIKRKDDLDEGYIVIGDGPPPVKVEDEDIDMQLLFGEGVSRKGVLTTEDATPDLMGIRQMLQMVHEYDGGDDDEDGKTNPSKASDCVVITKVNQLNPNVKDFVPKGLLPSQSDVNSKNSIKETIVTQTVEESRKNCTDINCNDVQVENNVNPDEYQDIATRLKNEISDAAKSDSFEFKKQKNVAIATLLRLYATNNKSPNIEPLKLITPEYFEGKRDSLDIKIESVNKTPQTVSSGSTSTTPEPNNCSSAIPTCSSNSIISTPQQTSSDNNLCETNTKRIPKNKIDPEIKRSIEKVNKWLEEPTKRKSAVCLGPVAFKRKEPKDSSSKSTSVITSDSEQVSKPSGEVQRYQPSNYAADLGRIYMERNKVKEDQKRDVTWCNLEEKLKQKDLLIKKRLEEQASSGNSNDDNSIVTQR